MKNLNKALILLMSLITIAAFSQTKTTLLYNGSSASKFDIVFMGDGFTSSNQSEFNNLVSDYFKAMFTHDNGNLDNVLSELQDAFNIYRVNLNSTQSGVTQYTCSNDDCSSNTASSKNTALNFKYSGCWNCCWMQKSSNTDNKINNALSTVGLSGADFVVVILNEPGFGGCSYGKVLSITKSMSNNVLLHELGHSVGRLADEYSKPGCFSGTNPSAVNVDKNDNPSKWNKFAKSTITTGAPTEYNVDGFEGGRYNTSCIYRPSSNSTMRGNTSLFNPPSYNEFWKRNKSKSNYNFNKPIIGNFQGNSYNDVVLHYGNYITAYPTEHPKGFTGSGAGITRPANSYVTTKRVKGPGGTWYVSSKDKFYVGDFTGDGYDDLLVFYPNNQYSRLGILKSTPTGFECIKKIYYNLPGWQMRNGDQFFIADFNGDGKDDFYIFNAVNWNQGYMGMFKSTGSNFSYVKRYDKYLPGHFMSSTDKYFVADYTGDNKEELILFNTNSKVTRMFKSSGISLSKTKEYFASLPGWTSKAGDKYHIADINGDGKDDVYIFNGTNWGPEYLLLLRSDGNEYKYIKRYDDALPGWNMNNHDKFYVADINGDGKDDLYVFNNQDWSTQYLGRVITNGSTVSVNYQSDWIGGWNLGSADKLIVDNRKTGRDNLFIHNTNWFAYMWSGTSNMYIKGMYKDYIHAFKYHDYGWY
ncbi:M64 family metallopeptidase [Tenacibaculum caenipelagi]|uniref:VCBS repeat protein n=1 Tax=Tenacibaculum caenipelagi TaxID=1325435 RepID=A0A4R6TDW0_9FLAO|nr:M64 family metallopeptidase [Tenacibaculum caenipelagi]TDQ27553.1 VCBS repeat protein [Tenacibaculum caenipelagi]